ncbi:MAG: glutamyl-tRNA reductase [Burkholderiaceae bacterium]|jgi:glutamyl-tRNA reductase|nr:glutamyl-tRNA reductase [Burkholderiaceae bacterium]
MQLVVLGLSHKTAPVEIRECFSLSEESVRHGLRHLSEGENVYECVILSTCNRTEIYAVVDDTSDALVLTAYMSDLTGDKFPVAEYLFCYEENECIRHLMRVAASLDSLIVGENQILSQVKKAYFIARNGGTTGTILNTLFNRAIAVGKKVRTQTRIGYNAVSVSHAAVEWVKKIVGDLSRSRVLLLGAGKMSELTARHLKAHGVRTTFVSNRNFSRAVELAERFGGIAVPLADFMKCAVDADIVIASTGTPHYIVNAQDVACLMPRRRGRPIIFVDIAVPRDVDPAVGAITGVSLYNIDALEAVVASNMAERTREACAAEVMVEEEMVETLAKFRYLAFRPMLTNLTTKVEHIRQRVLRDTLARLPDILPAERKAMEDLSRMLIRKILRDPIVGMTQAADTGQEHFYLKAMCALFKLEEVKEETHRDSKNCRWHPKQQTRPVAG